MPPSPPSPDPGSSTGTQLWYRWRGYSVRWLLFGLVVHVFQPVVDDLDQLWQQKLDQALTGLLFGTACTLVFTPTENAFNTPRVAWKSWLLVIGTWLTVKVTFVSIMGLSNP